MSIRWNFNLILRDHRNEGIKRRVETLDLTVASSGEVRSAEFLAFDQVSLFR
jgi:hypothetical protein